MPTVFDARDAAALRARFAKLTPESQARFGTLTAPRMVCHLIDAYRDALGETQTPFKGHVLSNPVLRWLVVDVFPFPRGAPTAPSYLATKPEQWSEDCARWEQLLTRIVERGGDAAATWGVHPAFGVMSVDMWGRLIHKHTAHHLAQFGA